MNPVSAGSAVSVVPSQVAQVAQQQPQRAEPPTEAEWIRIELALEDWDPPDLDAHARKQVEIAINAALLNGKRQIQIPYGGAGPQCECFTTEPSASARPAQPQANQETLPPEALLHFEQLSPRCVGGMARLPPPGDSLAGTVPPVGAAPAGAPASAADALASIVTAEERVAAAQFLQLHKARSAAVDLPDASAEKETAVQALNIQIERLNPAMDAILQKFAEEGLNTPEQAVAQAVTEACGRFRSASTPEDRLRIYGKVLTAAGREPRVRRMSANPRHAERDDPFVIKHVDRIQDEWRVKAAESPALRRVSRPLQPPSGALDS